MAAQGKRNRQVKQRLAGIHPTSVHLQASSRHKAQGLVVLALYHAILALIHIAGLLLISSTLPSRSSHIFAYQLDLTSAYLTAV